MDIGNIYIKHHFIFSQGLVNKISPPKLDLFQVSNLGFQFLIQPFLGEVEGPKGTRGNGLPRSVLLKNAKTLD
jgi:hypothetical protein